MSPFLCKMKQEEIKRLRRVLIKAALILIAGLCYALFVMSTGWGIPCVFYLVTHKLCPGCGITRMFLALLQWDFLSAARYNLLVLCLLPFALFLCLFKLWQYVKKGSVEMPTWEKVLYCIAVGLCLVFFVLRNSGWIPFLSFP